jgi:hypothetical protein
VPNINHINTTLPGLACLSYSINGAMQVTGFSRSRLYTFIRTGDLTTFKVGGRTYISHTALSGLVSKAEQGELATCG